jgi:hypothetical protein
MGLVHAERDEAIRLAEALVLRWREDYNEPGFMQPSGSLVRDVEGLIGEPVWKPEEVETET